MKKICCRSIALLLFLFPCVFMTHAQDRFPDNETALTNDINDVAGKELRDVDDPLRDGSYALSEGLNGIFNEEELQDTGTAWDRTTRYVKGILNYILGVIGLVALVYLIFQGFRALTAGSNEEEMSKATKGIKYATLAIVGVGIAWFILSLVFWLLQVITN